MILTAVALGALVFVIAAALDFADTNHKIAVERRNGHRAGLWSVAMYLLGLVGLVSVLEVSRWFIVPEALGLYIGSRIAMARQKRTRRTVSGVRCTCRRTRRRGTVTRPNDRARTAIARTSTQCAS